MNLKFKKLNFYFLTKDNNRKIHVKKEFSDFNLKEVNPNTEDFDNNQLNKNRSGISGHLKILDLGCKEQLRNTAFQPFIVLEDDVKKYIEFPESINIPDDTDILFIGLSTWGILNTDIGIDNSIMYEDINENIIRIYNMLSTHGYIICSARGALLLGKAYMEGYINNRTIWDVNFAQIQPYCNTYALKIPLVYQCKEFGGDEGPTKITIDNIVKNNVDSNYFNKSSVAIQTNY